MRRIMRRWIAGCSYLFLVSLFASAHQAPATQGSNAEVPWANVDRTRVENILKAYATAYQGQDLQAVLKVWPDLQNQPKELRKTKERFENPRISNTLLTLDIEDVRLTSDSALVKCKRLETYDQLEYSTYSSNDNQMGSMPSQNAGPSHLENKKSEQRQRCLDQLATRG
jgi:hypothetical protein